MPTPTLSLQTPFEVLFHSPPKLDHLRIFGYACYSSLKPYRTNKLEPKTVQCIFLDYVARYKGYICYDATNHKLIVSSHVLFAEDIFPSVSHQFTNKSKVNSKAPVCQPIPHPNTITHTPIIPIPLPIIFQSCSSPLDNPTNVTQSTSLSTGDLVPRSTSTLLAPTFLDLSSLELHPNTSVSQAQELQQEVIPSQNCHPMHARSKSGISKKRQVFSASVQFELTTK